MNLNAQMPAHAISFHHYTCLTSVLPPYLLPCAHDFNVPLSPFLQPVQPPLSSLFLFDLCLSMFSLSMCHGVDTHSLF